jgi:transposase
MSSKRYSTEFKMEAIKQVTERGYTVKEVADRLGMGAHTLYKWVRASGYRRVHVAADGDLRAEVARLKAELKRTQEERDILKKAAAYFAKASG